MKSKFFTFLFIVMIIVNVYGGLGNQLFQYAAGRQLAEKHHTTLKLDIENFKKDTLRKYSLHHFNIREVFCTAFDKTIIKGKQRIRKLINKTGGGVVYTERDFNFNNEVMELENNIYLDGNWGNEKYFKPIQNMIRNEFTVVTTPDDINKRYLGKIRSANSVAVHVRRGDYISDKETNAFHGVCSMGYYQEAIRQVSSRINDPYFFVFSDDIPWVKENLVIDKFPVDYVDHNKDVAHEDIRLMYSCKHNIVANSSFSWWGAWLNNNHGKIVIAPEKWLNISENKTELPDQWIQVHDPERG